MDKIDWQPMETAPKDGTQILIALDTACGWEFDVVYWDGYDKDYPWICGQYDGYPADRPDCWSPLTPPGESSMTDWQPMETAPKDGTLVDLWCDGERVPNCSYQHSSYPFGGEKDWGWFREHDEFSWYHVWLDRWIADEFNRPPTHWMPLPYAPLTPPDTPA